MYKTTYQHNKQNHVKHSNHTPFSFHVLCYSSSETRVQDDQKVGNYMQIMTEIREKGAYLQESQL